MEDKTIAIGEFCNRDVVVDEVDGKRVPVGIVTDRDLVIEVIAKSLDLDR